MNSEIGFYWSSVWKPLTSKMTSLQVGTPQLRAGSYFPLSIAMAVKTVTSIFRLPPSLSIMWQKFLHLARAAFCCHIPLHCSHLSEPNYIPRFPFLWDMTPHQWAIAARWLETVWWSALHRSKCPIHWIFWPITKWCGTTSLKNTYVNCITAEA